MALTQAGLQILFGCLGLVSLVPTALCRSAIIPHNKWATHRKAVGKGIYQTITCEKAIWDNRKACPPGLVMGDIIDAKYGRHLGGDICPFGGYFPEDPPCANYVLPLASCVENEDDYARSSKKGGGGGGDGAGDEPCHFQVSDKTMRGDPCPRTYKYLTVTFTCTKPDY